MISFCSIHRFLSQFLWNQALDSHFIAGMGVPRMSSFPENRMDQRVVCVLVNYLELNVCE